MPKSVTRIKKPEPSAEELWVDDQTRRRVFVAGFLGGSASALVKPMREVQTFLDLFDNTHLPVLLTAIVVGLLGCVLVWLFKEGNVSKALTITAGFSALIANVGATVSKGGNPGQTESKSSPQAPAKIEISEPAQPPGSRALGLLDFFAPPAYAQEPPHNNNAVPGAVSVEFISNEKFAYKVEVLDAQSNPLTSFDVASDDSEFVAKALPTGSAAFRFHTGSISSENYSIPPLSGDTTVLVDFMLETTRQVGVAQVLGKAVEVTPVLKIAVSTRAKAPVGTEGWIFIGRRTAEGWKSMYLSPAPPAFPNPNDELVVTFPLNIRSEAGATTELKGTASAGQKVRIAEVKHLGEEPVWARMTILSVNAP